MTASGTWLAAGGAPGALGRIRERARTRMRTELAARAAIWRAELSEDLVEVLCALAAKVAAEAAADDAFAIASNAVNAPASIDAHEAPTRPIETCPHCGAPRARA